MTTDANVLLLHPEVKQLLIDAFAGSSDLREFGARTLGPMLNALMSIQASDARDAGYGERSDERGNSRNGYRERGLSTTMGDVTLSIPKLRRGSYFPEDLIGRYSRCETALAAAVAEMCARGVSTRKVEGVAREPGVASLSKSQVSRLTAELDAEVEAFRARDLSHERYAYLWLDATYVKCRVGGSSASRAVVTAIGLEASGNKRLPAVDVVDVESYQEWRSFLLALRGRGLSGVRMVVSDDHSGLVRAMAELVPGAAWQRRAARLERNVLDRTHADGGLARARAVLRATSEQGSALVTRACHRMAADAIGADSPRAAAPLGDAGQDALAFLGLPRPHRRALRTNDTSERANKGIRRRVRVVESFPSEGSAVRLIGAVLAEVDEGWAQRRLLGTESVAKVWEPVEDQLPSDGEVEEARGKAGGIIAAALEEARAKG